MSATGANVFRWSALGLGIAYGIYHQRQIHATDKMAGAKEDYNRQAELIQEAKRQYAKLTAPRNGGGSGGVVTNIEDPNFDLEKVLLKA